MSGAIARALERLRLAKVSVSAQIGEAWTSAKHAEGLQLLDSLKSLGVSLTRPARIWQKPIWYTLHALSVWHWGVELVNLVKALAYSKSSSVCAWYATLTTGMMILTAATLILRYRVESMQQVRSFIETRVVVSGDDSYDAAERNVFARRSRITARLMLLMLIMDTVVLSIPNPPTHKLLFDPLNRIVEAESVSYRTVRFIFLCTFTIVWMSKYFWAFGSLSLLLLGLSTEQRILAHRFENDLLRMKSRVTTMAHFDSSYHLYRWQARDTFWKQLKADVGTTLEQHMELIRTIHLLQACIGKVFLLFYIYAVVGFGSSIFVIMNERLSLVSAVLMISVFTIALQGFWWCWLIESIPDINEDIHGTVYEMCALLPYDAEHCSSYRQMRSSLMIVAICLANADRIRCVGVRDITVDLFANTLTVSYDMLKFLMGFHQ